MVVGAGDTVTATVRSIGDRRFRLTLVDDTQGERFSIIETSRAAECNTAEVIVEAPLDDGLGLADFDPVHFTKCAVDGRPIGAFHWTRIDMYVHTSDVSVDAQPSALSVDGASFTVTRR
ncbi:MAG TPA: G1 family glutamic endopeptidase [Coriobacteriia bacterium]|nr:G1 family glutamic endopeptidase [Coriobacteriia bacterium]